MSDRPRAFVLMPFERQSDQLFDRILCPALEKAGMSAIRADSVLDQQSVMRDVVEGIADAALVVAEISQVNANVYYELGLAHGLRKPTVLLTQDISKVPFDLKGYRVLSYSTLFHEVDELSARLTEIAAEHLAGRVRFGSPITDYLPGPGPPELPLAVPPALAAGADDLPEDGYLDWLADIHEADRQLGVLMTDVVAATNQVGDQMAARGSEIDQIVSSGGADLSPSKARTLARAAAADLSAYAKTLELITPKLSEEAQRFVRAGLNLAEWFRDPTRDPSGREEFRSSVRSLLDATTEGREGLDEYREVVAGLRGISSDMNRSSSRTTRDLDEMFEVFDSIAAFCQRCIAILPMSPGMPEQ